MKKKEDASAPFLYTPSCAFSQEDSIDLPPTLRSRKIVVVGSINIDNTFSVDGVPQAGETTRILDSTVSLGGKGANQAIGAARLGSEVSLITSIGSDLDSNFAIHALTSEQLSTQGVFRDMGMQTGKAYIYIQGDGESTITILPGANAHLSSERIRHRRHLFQNAGYCLLSTEIPLEAAIEAARISHSCGAKNIVNPAALKLMPKELIPYTDIFIPNRKAAAALCRIITTSRIRRTISSSLAFRSRSSHSVMRAVICAQRMFPAFSRRPMSQPLTQPAARTLLSPHSPFI